MLRRVLEAVRLKQLPATSFLKLWLLAPIAVWFSYYPLVNLGKTDTVRFELSISLIYVLVLALAGLPIIWRERGVLARSKAVWLVSAFVLISGLSLLWTVDISRGFLTIAVVGLLYLVFVASVAIASELKVLAPALTRLFIGNAVIMSCLSFVQFVAGIWLEPSLTLLCRGCIVEQFGFSRPSLFAIEPQFLGNLLLAPALILAHLSLAGARSRHVFASFVIVTTALFLTLSRGAIFAFLVGALILIVLQVRYPKRLAKVSGAACMSLLLCLLMQGFSAVLTPRANQSFAGAVSTSASQLSLGLIDLDTDKTQPAATIQKPDGPKAVKPPAAPVFEGYVEESTNTRLTLSKFALRTWRDDAFNTLFGVGVGGSVAAMRQTFPDDVNVGEIVQNEYIEVLLETGALGFVIFAAMIIGLLHATRSRKWLWAIAAGFLAQWNFFSGYPNALHIYLILILLVIVSLPAKAKKSPTRPRT